MYSHHIYKSVWLLVAQQCLAQNAATYTHLCGIAKHAHLGVIANQYLDILLNTDITTYVYTGLTKIPKSLKFMCL